MGNGVKNQHYQMTKNAAIHRRSCRSDDEGIFSCVDFYIYKFLCRLKKQKTAKSIATRNKISPRLINLQVSQYCCESNSWLLLPRYLKQVLNKFHGYKKFVQSVLEVRTHFMMQD